MTWPYGSWNEGWSLKWLQREIALSQAYGQSSDVDAAESVDRSGEPLDLAGSAAAVGYRSLSRLAAICLGTTGATESVDQSIQPDEPDLDVGRSTARSAAWTSIRCWRDSIFPIPMLTAQSGSKPRRRFKNCSCSIAPSWWIRPMRWPSDSKQYGGSYQSKIDTPTNCCGPDIRRRRRVGIGRSVCQPRGSPTSGRSTRRPF